MSSAARTEAACLKDAIKVRPLHAETFEVYRVRSLDWHDAKPELLHRCTDFDEAMQAGQTSTQPKAFFYIRRAHGPRRIMVDSIYIVRTTTKHTMSRAAYDGPYAVREKGRVAEHLFDLAVPA
jgi:hypothetical protein